MDPSGYYERLNGIIEGYESFSPYESREPSNEIRTGVMILVLKFTTDETPCSYAV
jgi:hypothetical protein